MQINRDEFLQILEYVRPGLSTKGEKELEQSSCFVFKPGQVQTYNEDICCRASTPFNGELKGAVPSGPLLAMMDKLVEETLDVEVGETRVSLKGKNRGFHVNLEGEIHLPFETVEKPGKFAPLPEGFLDAARLTCPCAGRKSDEFLNTCVHITATHVEAFDNYQVGRYKIKTGFETPALIKAEALKHVPPFGATEIARTENWTHFKNAAGAIMSCRHFNETSEYPDLSEVLPVTGDQMAFPKGLVDAIANAEEFSRLNPDDENYVRIELRNNKLKITGEGASGGYWERKKITYAGPKIVFLVAPQLLSELIRQHSGYRLDGNERLIVSSGRFRYVVCLSKELTDAELEELKAKDREADAAEAAGKDEE